MIIAHLIRSHSINYVDTTQVLMGVHYGVVGGGVLTIEYWNENKRLYYIGQVSDNKFIHFFGDNEYEFIDDDGVVKLVKSWIERASKLKTFT